ncbi:hypothetical protein GHO40_16155 [Pseudomonas helleri]|uniref:Capsular biosynthesis protein n=1 Tax=Pseudomonas helleri TaxID=1608996 RepID=A0A7X1XEU3_9PSED|nr:hypothetical protein [Pseudomonas helleri]MQT48240.1 hypothetical protein [Pseudomonas helleri]MQT90218.1 hypothetical protein [Pseudomonas helleri]
MSAPNAKLLLVLDDREFAFGEVRNLVGSRRFGDIVFKRQPLIDHFRAALPVWIRSHLIRLQTDDDLVALRSMLETCSEDTSVCVIAGRAGFSQAERLTQLVERLPYAEEDFTDTLYKPLLVFLRNAHGLVEQWPAFMAAPLHTWEKAWQGSQRLQSVEPLDLGKIRDFLSYTSGSTATRHFNEMEIDTYYYTKQSSDKLKMLAEYSFYGLVPESMRPWLIQPFDFDDSGDRASYKMLRYYLADTALQWVHGAFEVDTFTPFVDRLLFFLAERSRRACTKEQSAAMAHELFVSKLQARVKQFLTLEEGQRINKLAFSANPELDISYQLERFLKLYKRHEKGFVFDHRVVGHGDPCFSNVLYDQQRYLMKLIDPKGALNEEGLWTHPLYDLCKVSHSALGDYDFINNGLYDLGFTDSNELFLRFKHTNHAMLKPIFLQRLKAAGHDVRVMRLGEASLFLSMLPLHIDYPNKVIAFLLNARQILDEVESESRF